MTNDERRMAKDEWRIMVSLRSVFQCENDRIQISLNSLLVEWLIR